MKKFILSLFWIGLFLVSKSFGQGAVCGICIPVGTSSICEVDIHHNGQLVDTIIVCPGESVTLEAVGEIALVQSNFNNGLGVGFSSVSGAVFTNPCGAPSCSTLPDPYFWMSTAAATTNRFLETDPLNLSIGGTICFDFRMQPQAGTPAGCDGPDLAHEGVSLQYSIDNGVTWVTMTYFSPSGVFLPVNPGTTNGVFNPASQFLNWANYSFVIPPAAQTAQTKLRLFQSNVSASSDSWGLDNFQIIAVGTPVAIWNGSSATMGSTFTFNPTTDTFIVAQINPVSPCRDTIWINMQPNAPTAAVISTIPPTPNNNVTICEGESITLGTFGGEGDTLYWERSTFANNWVIAQGSNPLDSLNTGPLFTSTKYRFTSFTQLCGVLYSNEITVTVIPKPDFSVTSNDTICEGQSTVLTALGVQGDYTWTPTTGLTFPAAPLTSIVNATPTQTTFYTVKQTNAFGCSDSAIVTVAVVPYPILNAVPTDGVCGSNNGSIAANVSSGTPPYIYVYNGGIGTVDNVLTGLGPGTYPVEVVDKHGCRVYDTVVVRDYIDIDAQLSWYSQNSFYSPGPPIEGSAPFEISFTNQSTGTITNFEWYFGNGDSLAEIVPFNATTNHVTYNEDGTYTVVLIAYNNNPLCADTFVVEVQAIGTSAINMVPNVITPNGDGINDLFDAEMVNIIKVNAKIFNRWGKEVYGWDQLDRPWRGLNNDGAELPPGTYFYTLTGEGIDGKKHEKSGFVQLLR